MPKPRKSCESLGSLHPESTGKQPNRRLEADQPSARRSTTFRWAKTDSLITRQSILLVALAVLGARTGPQRNELHETPKEPVSRVDVDRHQVAGPRVSFEVDCTPLTYAKGAEREFCYANGKWAILRLDAGTLVACNCGEFGRFLQWYGRERQLVQTLLANAKPQTVFSDGRSLQYVSGISYLSISEGGIHTFRFGGGEWCNRASLPLPSEARRVEREDDGALLISTFEGDLIRFRNGVLEGVR